MFYKTVSGICVRIVKYEGDVGKTLEEGIKLLSGFGVLKSPFIIKPKICASVERNGFAITAVKIAGALINLVLKKDGYMSVKIVESDSESKLTCAIFSFQNNIQLS